MLYLIRYINIHINNNNNNNNRNNKNNNTQQTIYQRF